MRVTSNYFGFLNKLKLPLISINFVVISVRLTFIEERVARKRQRKLFKTLDDIIIYFHECRGPLRDHSHSKFMHNNDTAYLD